MTINACVKNMRTNSLPRIQSPVALIFKDEGGLANQPLSCHPQGVFDKRENERKGKKRENSRPVSVLVMQNEKSLSTVSTNGLI